MCVIYGNYFVNLEESFTYMYIYRHVKINKVMLINILLLELGILVYILEF